MRTVTFLSVRDSVCHLMGVDPQELQANLAASITDAINRAVRRGWEADAWWPWTVEEERHWRQTWRSGETYAAGTEVWHEGTERYYRAVVMTSITPGTDNAIWEAITPAATIDFAEPTETEIGRLVGVFSVDGKQQFDFLLTGDRAHFAGGAPDPIALQFCQVRPVFSSKLWDAAVAYSTGAVVLRGEDSYRALGSSTGVDPATNAALWAKQPMPDILAHFVVQEAYATMLEIDMQSERSLAARALARQLLEEEMDNVFLTQQQVRNFRVKSGGVRCGGGGGGKSRETAGVFRILAADGVTVSSPSGDVTVGLTDAIRTGSALGSSAVQPGSLAPVATSGEYADLQNIPAEFAPSAHTHLSSEITDLASNVVQSIAASLGVTVDQSNGAVALQLTSGAQASLAKADTAIQSVSGASPHVVASTTSGNVSVALTTSAAASLAKAETALQSVSGGTGITVTGTTSATVALTTAASASLALADTAVQRAGDTMTGNLTLNGTANTAPSQVFGANNLLTGAVGDARYSWLPAIEVNAAFAPYYGSTPQTIANTLSSTANTVSYADGANGVPLTFMLPWQQWAGKTIKCGAVIAVNGTSGGNLALRFRVQYFTAAQLADESQEFWLSVGGAGTDATGSSSSPQIIAAPTAANRVKLVETGDITIPATARQIAFSFDPLRTNAGDTNTDLLYVHTLRAEVI
jgi:hypothetical protein